MSNVNKESLKTIYKGMTLSDPPAPWKRVSCFISGVTAVGFGEETELMLVLTHSGIGVIDCISGDVIEHVVNADDYVEDPYPVTAKGIGPLVGQHIRLAGLWGGGLRTMTPDGWKVHRAAPNWPDESAILCPPEAPELYDDPIQAVMLVKDVELGIRAVGFSDSGQTLVVASTDLFIWTRIP